MERNNSLTLLDSLNMLKTGDTIELKTNDPIVVCYSHHGGEYDPEANEVATQLFYKQSEDMVTRYTTHESDNTDHYITEDRVLTINAVGVPELDLMMSEVVLPKGVNITTNSCKLFAAVPEVVAMYYSIMEMDNVPLKHLLPGNVRLQQLTELPNYNPEWLGITKLHHNRNCVTFTTCFQMNTHDAGWLTSDGRHVIIDAVGGTQKSIEEPTHVYIDLAGELVYRATQALPVDVLRNNFSGARKAAKVKFQGIEFTIFDSTVVEVH